jgi:hypothetical protein
MTAVPHPPPTASPLSRVTDLLWVGLPLAIRRVSAGLAVATVDGLYLASRPLVGLLAPVGAFLLGLIFGVFHPGFEAIFTESLLLLLLITVVGTLSGAVGLYLTLGFALGDLALGDHPLWRYAELADAPAQYGSLLLSYLLLAMLAVGVPIAAKSFAAEFMLPVAAPRALRAIVGLGAMIFINGLLVYVWLQSAPLLVRPVFLWAGQTPTVPAIAPMQEDWPLIVAISILAAIGRAVAQLLLAVKIGQPDRMTQLEERFRTAAPIVPLLSRLPLALRLVMRAAMLTLVLAGLYAALWQALLSFVVLLGAQFLGAVLSARAMKGYARIVNKIPRLIRLIVVVVPVYLLGSVVLSFYLDRGQLSFLPFLVLTIVSAILMSLLSPARPDPEEQK